MTTPANATPAPVGVVVFDFEEWSAIYPALASQVNEAQAQNDFNIACLYLNNTPQSLVTDLTERKTLLYLLVAHLVKLDLNAQAGAAGGAGSGMVGRIANASRGSTAIGASGEGIPKNGWWFAQTPWGAAFMQATIKYRRARFVIGRAQPARIWP